MMQQRPLLKGLGILFLALLLFFVAVSLYTYFTGGEEGVATLFRGDGVGVLMVEGTLNDAGEAIRSLKRFGEMAMIKAVILRIESPGGGVVPTQEIYEEIEKLKKKKPVIASLGGVAASGGYYIASACDQIVANPGTLTGSIGVIMELANVEGLMEKLGVKEYPIKSGPHKDIGSPFRPLTNEGKKILQSLVDNVHGQFVRAVAKGRGLPEEKVRELADGRIYSGEQAKAIGLVDILGNMEDAIELAARQGGIEGTPEVFYAQAQSRSWWERLFFMFLGESPRTKMEWGLRYQWTPGLAYR